MMMDTKASRIPTHAEINTPFASRTGADFIEPQENDHEMTGMQRSGSSDGRATTVMTSTGASRGQVFPVRLV